MPSEKELLDRIRQLEEQNNDLQDKLDAIYSILAPDYEQFQVEEIDETDDSEPSIGLVNIKPA
jgi:hypothetical protein